MKHENYRYTEDGILLVRKMETGHVPGMDLMPGCRERWYRCSDRDPDRQYLKMVLGGWFGLHKFMEGSVIQGIFYALTCGCFGVFYVCDLLSILCGTYCYRQVTYVDGGQGIQRKMQKIYYAPLEHRKSAAFLLLPAAVILILAVCFLYQPVGKLMTGWIASAVSGRVTMETADRLMRLL